VRVSTGLTALSAVAKGNVVELKLSDGSKRRVDHVLLATGYKINVKKYEFLSESLASSLQLVDGCPVLGRGFESSVPGLHFVGAPAVWSYGPLMRFVAGADFASRAVTQTVVRVRRTAIGRPIGDALHASQNVVVSRGPKEA
jgi:hypothetical protein